MPCCMFHELLGEKQTVIICNSGTFCDISDYARVDLKLAYLLLLQLCHRSTDSPEAETEEYRLQDGIRQ